VDGNINEQVSTFKYLGCEVLCRNNRDTEAKLNRFSSFCSIRHTLGKKGCREMLLKLYKVMIALLLLYGYEILSLRADHIRREAVK
jgi:hypothetical protein